MDVSEGESRSLRSHQRRGGIAVSLHCINTKAGAMHEILKAHVSKSKLQTAKL